MVSCYCATTTTKACIRKSSSSFSLRHIHNNANSTSRCWLFLRSQFGIYNQPNVSWCNSLSSTSTKVRKDWNDRLVAGCTLTTTTSICSFSARMDADAHDTTNSDNNRKEIKVNNMQSNNNDAVIDGTSSLSSSSASWCCPSTSQAAYAFAKLSCPNTLKKHKKGTDITKPTTNTVGVNQFIRTIQELNLNFNLSTIELERVFNSLDKNKDGQLSLEEFKIGSSKSPFIKSLVDVINNNSFFNNKQYDANYNFPCPQFDPTISTAEYYKAPIEHGFVGGYTDIRKSLDYTYHNNYTHERQYFQDALIHQNVIFNTNQNQNEQHHPWLIYTCGPMGVGKGYVLGWMSVNEILPLEHVSKIDPDTFKLRMPEWSLYTKHTANSTTTIPPKGSRTTNETATTSINHNYNQAGTRTHLESSYISEIAIQIAMNHNMNIWVDGSLRNYEWHINEFDKIRSRYPHYKIAILIINAKEQTIQNRIVERYKQTGRYIPQELYKRSYEGINDGMKHFIKKVDLIASIHNDDTTTTNSSKPQEPQLEFVSLIDRSGNWDLMRNLTHFS